MINLSIPKNSLTNSDYLFQEGPSETFFAKDLSQCNDNNEQEPQ